MLRECVEYLVLSQVKRVVHSVPHFKVVYIHNHYFLRCYQFLTLLTAVISDTHLSFIFLGAEGLLALNRVDELLYFLSLFLRQSSGALVQ